jgi:molecular chaperone DnaJ
VDVQREWLDKDYYSVLGVEEKATAKEITSAYRNLAKKYHPDANPNNSEAEEKFKEIASAFEVLGNDEKRKSYDQVREMVKNGNFGSGQGGSFFDGFGGSSSQGFGSAGFNIEDIFSSFFGGGFSQSSGRPSTGRVGDDLETVIKISFEESLTGASKEVKFRAEADCEPCKGNGTADGAKPAQCSTCRGTGTVQQSRGFFAFEQTCPTCRGAGFQITNPCSSCRGQGRVLADRVETVPIPKGIDNGQRIRLQGRGGAGYLGGPSGDLFIRVSVDRHKLFLREDSNLFIHVPVTYAEAALGSEVEVPTPFGSVKIKVPNGTTTGDQLRVKGKGVETDRRHGDLYIIFDVNVPKKLSKSQKKIVESLAAELNEKPREKFYEYLN